MATWGAAACHLQAREEFIGWSAAPGRRRRGLLANHARLRVRPDCHSPTLLSRFLKLMLRPLSADWAQRWGHPLALVETFGDPRC